LRLVLHAALCLLPALLVALPLLLRRYPGERALSALRRRAEAPLRARLATPARRERASAVVIARGPRLLAFSLAVRPPPLLS
jgi:hypothetical protein